MNDADTLGVLTVLLCLLGSMFFSGSETAITSMDERRARRMVEEGGFRGKVMSSWVSDPVRVLSTILIGNNIVNTLMGAVVTALALRHLAGGPNGDYAVPIAVTVTTALLLIFGEITPKALGRVYSERVSVPALYILGALSRLIAPVLWLVTKLTNLFLKGLVGDADQSMNRVTADEIGYLVDVGHREGSIRAGQAALIQGIIRFEDKIVRDIMVPGDRVTAVGRAWDVRRVREVAARSGHSRLPVFDGDINNIVGVLHIKQLVGVPDTGSIERIMRAPVFISESLRLHDLLTRFKENRGHLAIVVDDAGDTVGVVTLEDVLEQIVGQIFDETDRAPPQIQQDQPGLAFFDGQESLTMVEERLAVEIEEEIEGVVSIGDLLTHLAGQIPIAGSVFVWEGLRFKVVAADARHVIRVSVEQVEADDDEDD